MRLILVRHGETVDNKKGIIGGIRNRKLSPEGLAQARKVAERLKEEKIEFIYSSDLQRAYRTAKEIAKHHRLPIIITNLLREQNLGVLEGQPRKNYPHSPKLLQHPLRANPPKGEPTKEMKKRTLQFYRSLFERHKYHTVLLATHGGPIMMLLTHLHDESYSRYLKFRPGNTAVTIIDVKDVKGRGKHKIKLLNCTRHLA
jgi:broad specificity phosphatase PhoE